MDCSWCERPATYFLLSDRDSRNSVDHACDEHMEQWRHLYRRAVPVPVTGPAQPVVDLREPRVVDLRDVDTVEAAVPVPRLTADAELAHPAPAVD